MDLKDATLMLLAESAAYPALAGAAQTAYDALASGQQVPYQALSELIGDASGKGVLRELRHRYSATAFEAIVFPICREIDRQKPVPPRRRPAGPDPLTDPGWRPDSAPR
jgi:hypothetical protein